MRAWMIAWSWIDGLSGFLGLMPAMFSPMVFANAANVRASQVLFFCLASYPVVCAGAIALGWWLHSNGMRNAGAACIAAPLLNVGVGWLAAQRLGD